MRNVAGPVKITKKRAITLMERAVVERGEDWVFPTDVAPMGCFYVLTDETWNDCLSNLAVDEDENDLPRHLNGIQSGSPACLVGLALSFEDFIEVIPVHDKIMRTLSRFNYDSVSHVAKHLEEEGIILTPKAVEVFEAAQQAQDAGDRWGLALEAAKSRAKHL